MGSSPGIAASLILTPGRVVFELNFREESSVFAARESVQIDCLPKLLSNISEFI